MALLKFLKGNYSNLSTAAINEGQILICNDTAEMFVDVAADKRIKIGDFTVIENLTALEALDATAVPTSRLYYVEDGNILARSNGTTWVQVNKQPTAAELKTLLGLGTAAYTDATAYDAAGAADAVREYVGDIPTDDEGNPIATSVVAYINKKTDGIATSGNLEALGVRVTTAEGEIDALQEASAKHVEKVEGKSLIADTEITRLAGMSDGANKVEASETNGNIKIDGVETTVYTHPDKHAIGDVDGLSQIVSDLDTLEELVGVPDNGKDPEASDHVSASGIFAELEYIDGHVQDCIDSWRELNEWRTGNDVPGDSIDDKIGANAAAITTLNGDDTTEGSVDYKIKGVKDYVDTTDIFETDMLTVNAHGGVAANEDLNGLTTHAILKKILYPYVQPVLGNATASPNGGTYEKGVTKTITSVSISVTKKSELITSVALYNGSTLVEEKTGDAVKNGGTITFSGLSIEVPTNGNQLTVKVTDAKGTVQEKKTTAMSFVYPYYIGTCAAGTTIDETLVESLTKKVEGKGNKPNSFTVSDGHMVFAYPKAHGVLKSILDPNNFETIGNYTCSEVSVTGLDGTAQAYYVYVSGATTVSGFVVNFKY